MQLGCTDAQESELIPVNFPVCEGLPVSSFLTVAWSARAATAKPGCESRNSLRKGNPQDQKRQPHDLSRRQPTNGRFRKTCVRSQKVEAISEKCSSVFNELVYDRELLRPFPRNARPNRKNVR